MLDISINVVKIPTLGISDQCLLTALSINHFFVVVVMMLDYVISY